MRDEIKKVFCGILVCLLVAVLLPVNAIASRGDMCLGGNGCSNGNVCHNGNVCQNQGELSKVACKSLAKMKIRYAKVKNDNSQVTVGWYKVKNSTHTLIYRKSVGEKWKFIGKVKSTTVKFVDKNPLDGTNFYKVRAYNSRSKVYGKFSYSKKVVLKHVHNFGAWKAISPSTCIHDGEKVRVCKGCGYRECRKVQRLGHDMVEDCEKRWVPYWTCNICGARFGNVIDVGIHCCMMCGGGYTACKEQISIPLGHHCTRCGITEQGTKLEHRFSDWYLVVDPTCTHDGERARYCYICQEKESIVLPKLNRQHQFELLVTHPELGCATYKCKYCRETEFRDL